MSELDLWFPGALMDSQQNESLDLAAVTFESWFQLAEVLGRRDILLFAASYGIDLVAKKSGDSKARSATLPWLDLSQVPHSEVGRAAMSSSAADVLARLGEHERALEAYRQARKIFLTIDSKLGQAPHGGEKPNCSLGLETMRGLSRHMKNPEAYIRLWTPNSGRRTHGRVRLTGPCPSRQ